MQTANQALESIFQGNLFSQSVEQIGELIRDTPAARDARGYTRTALLISPELPALEETRRPPILIILVRFLPFPGPLTRFA